MTTTIHGSSPLDPLFTFLSYALIQAESVFYKIPGSHVIARYVKSSHQNDPGRTVLEILLALFAIRTLLQSRTRADNAEKHFIQFSEKVCFFLQQHVAYTYLRSNRRLTSSSMNGPQNS